MASERSVGLTVARIGASLTLAAAALAVLRPFLTPIAWAAILAYVTWPVYRRLRAHSRRPRLAAAAFTVAVAFGIGGPVALLLVTLADQANALVGVYRSWVAEGAPLPGWLAGTSWGQSALDLLPERADPAAIGQWLGRVGTRFSRDLLDLAGGLARNAFKFVVAMVSLYAFYVDGEAILAMARRLAPLLFPTAPDRFLERIGASVRAVMFGLLGTALLQGALAALGLAVAGVPSPVVLGAGTALLSFLPGGAGAIPLTAAAWLGLSGRLFAAVGLALWSLLVISSVDNVLRPVLISGVGRIAFLLVFLGILGGLGAFGLVGIFVGPVVLSVALTLLTEFARQRTPAAEPARQPPGDAED